MDDCFTGIVECEFVDAGGRLHTFLEKVKTIVELEERARAYEHEAESQPDRARILEHHAEVCREWIAALRSGHWKS